MSASRVAVIAHRGKTLDGGLPELRRVLADRGVTDAYWREVPKSRFAPKQVRKALARGCDPKPPALCICRSWLSPRRVSGFP